MQQVNMTSLRSRAAVAQCWTVQTLLLLALLTLSLLSGAIQDNFTDFLYDPGDQGWRLFCFVLPVYSLMSIAAWLSNARWMRWLHAALLSLASLLPVAHQAKHFVEGKPPDLSLGVEVAMLLCALAGAIVAVRWARQVG
nr:hypothetical protein [uncultured Caldimonas sp.]